VCLAVCLAGWLALTARLPVFLLQAVCDALGAHGVESSAWRSTLEAMPPAYFEDFIQALADAEAKVSPLLFLSLLSLLLQPWSVWSCLLSGSNI
jgi:hypothetical protein